MSDEVMMTLDHTGIFGSLYFMPRKTPVVLIAIACGRRPPKFGRCPWPMSK
jgi:hypothetical protein